jgi:hypothetical protein
MAEVLHIIALPLAGLMAWAVITEIGRAWDDLNSRKDPE